MHSQHVMKPDEIRRQLENFQRRFAEVGNDWLRLTPDEFAFLQLGGQTPNALLPGLLPDICRGTKERTYALLMEYVDPDKPETRVPMAYNFGFTELPVGDPRFPNMDPNDIARSNGKYSTMAKKILAIWRSGVVNSMDAATVSAFAELGIVVPPELLGKSGRRRGLNNRFKPPLAAAVLGQKELIIYNTVVATEPGNAAIGMPNAAIRGSNEGVFMCLGVRNTLEHMKDDTGRAVADIGFDVFGNKPQSILDAELDEDSVLMSKGGFEDAARFVAEAHAIAEAMSRRGQQRLVP